MLVERRRVVVRLPVMASSATDSSRTISWTCPTDSSASASRSATPLANPVSTSQSDTLASAQEQPGQLGLGVLAATVPVGVGVGVPRQPEQRCAMRADREPELGVERRIEVRERLGVGLVEPVLEPARSPASSQQPCTWWSTSGTFSMCSASAAIATAVIHTLQASRNFSASSSGLRSP